MKRISVLMVFVLLAMLVFPMFAHAGVQFQSSGRPVVVSQFLSDGCGNAALVGFVPANRGSFQFQGGRRGVQFQQSGGGQNIQINQRRGLLDRILGGGTQIQSSGPNGNFQFNGR